MIKLTSSWLYLCYKIASNSTPLSQLLTLPMDSSSLLLLSILYLSLPISFSLKTNALVSPTAKDPATLQYFTRVYQRTPFVNLNVVLDLGGRYLWVDCDKGYVSSTYRPVRCRSAECSLANANGCGDCFSKARPGCNNNTCGVSPENPFIRTSTGGELATDVFSLPSTDGYKPGPAAKDPQFIFSCGPTFLLKGLANGTSGIIGLGRTKVAPPEQLASTFSFQRTFAICLSGSIGVMFYGGGPYVFLPGIDVSKSLIYTPLLINPVSTAGTFVQGEKSAEYFIGVKSIKINEKPVKLNQTLLNIDQNGVGGTKISTVNPYTLLETSIYKAVLDAFGTALSKVKKVKPVAPFGLCFDAKSIGSTRVGPAVPAIDLVLQSESVYWRIFGANSMVAVGNNALCLGFVDAGKNPRTSIVIGGYQLEDNLLAFDLARSRLGFSSSLLFRQTTCSNFDMIT
ncbi:Eukaryotic aspartyl protease family protein [Rhynchospora pubera]|uniref:Eukaryotic aspartyl protease family protein n=1 Tax=Rhynchospora pubera TaxID=906938 RepID=A0AAV8DIM3_9POAL|nr:Eukaryotic aspartyl protease family protein [Rhynchospora pubera]